MRGWRRQFSRPAVWLLGGLLASAAGAGVAVPAVNAAAKIPGIYESPPCRTDFADDCVTVRDAFVINDGYYYRTGRGTSWFVGVKRWSLRLEEAGPDGDRDVRVELRNQAGRQKLIRGIRVTIIYVAKDAAWIGLSDGTVLTTQDHPSNAAPIWAALVLVAGGTGTSLAHTAVRTARRQGTWFGRARIHVEPNIGLYIAIAGPAALGLVYLLPRPAPMSIFILLLLLFAAIRALPWGRILRRRPPRGRHAAHRLGRHAATRRRGNR